MSAAEGRLSAPSASICAWAAFSRASKARPSAPVKNGLSSSSERALPRRSSGPPRRSRRLLAGLLSSCHRLGRALRVHAAGSRAGEGYGAAMAEQLFVFVQLEFPWALGPPDGRYLMRASPGGRAGAGDRAGSQALRTARRRRRRRTRVTVIDPVSLSAEQPGARLAGGLRARARARHRARRSRSSTAMLYLHRLAAADPHVHEVSPAQALAVRAGWGEGEQLAYGRWAARERAAGRGERPGARGRAAPRQPPRTHLRALARRAPGLAAGRARAAAGLRGAGAEGARRTSTRAATRTPRSSCTARSRRPSRSCAPRSATTWRCGSTSSSSSPAASSSRRLPRGGGAEPDAEVLGHALGRLEAALRARQLRL